MIYDIRGILVVTDYARGSYYGEFGTKSEPTVHRHSGKRRCHVGVQVQGCEPPAYCGQWKAMGFACCRQATRHDWRAETPDYGHGLLYDNLDRDTVRV